MMTDIYKLLDEIVESDNVTIRLKELYSGTFMLKLDCNLKNNNAYNLQTKFLIVAENIFSLLFVSDGGIFFDRNNGVIISKANICDEEDRKRIKKEFSKLLPFACRCLYLDRFKFGELIGEFDDIAKATPKELNDYKNKWGV